MRLKFLLFLLFPLFSYSQTVVDIVVDSDDHTILEQAVLAAELAGTLSGDGPFTLFAPTDAAFGLLPDGTLETLLEEPGGTLTDILLYHAVAGQAESGDLSVGQVIETINGATVEVTIENNQVFINGALVSMADVPATNGVVHVIDAVLLPPDALPASVVEVVVNSEDHTILEQAVIAADLAGTLSGEGPFTLFAPTDAAFGFIPDGTLKALLEEP